MVAMTGEEADWFVKVLPPDSHFPGKDWFTVMHSSEESVMTMEGPTTTRAEMQNG